MSDRVPTPSLPPDPGLPGVRGLFRSDGAEVLTPFLATRSWSLVESRPVQVTYQPGRSCIVRYRVRAGNRQGEPRLMTLSAEARHRPGKAVTPHPAFEERYGLHPVERIEDHLVWAYPYDPSLEGLPDAAWGPAVRDRLGAVGRPLRAVAAQPLRYRPRRRAVFRYTGLHGGRRAAPPETLYGKVVRGSKVERWRRASSLRVPRRARLRLALPIASPPGGPLLFEPLEGRSLRDLLVAGGSLPAPHRVAGLLDALPRAVGTDASTRDHRRPLRAAISTRDLVAAVTPHATSAADRVVALVAEGVSRDVVPTRTIHGDLYEAQVFVGRKYSLGLLDLDDVGPGDPAMDAANFCAHLVALALVRPEARARLMAYRSLAREAFLARLDIASADMAWREALVMFHLATGPLRTLSPRWPDEVTRRVDLALRLSEAA